MDLEEKIVKKLLETGYSVTTAESCTGGLLAGRILNVSGASEVYKEGHITYANEAKERILGVRHETLTQFGAVSRETAEEMVVGAARIAGAETALSTTGIAGPGGGTPEKPVGLIYVGCLVKKNVRVKELRLHGTREENRRDTVEKALQLLHEMLEAEES